MKKYINRSIIYAILAMVGGVFYREFTKIMGFTGVTALGKVHVHLLVLGTFVYLIISLFSKQINFEKEKTFVDCINPETKARYRFDFYVNNNYIIEFDGEQHFKPVDVFGGMEYFETLQARDNNKNLYCRNKNIPIIRIPYYHLNKLSIEDLKLETSKFIIN